MARRKETKPRSKAFRLVDTAWETTLRTALEADHSRVLLITPFIKRSGLERLMANCWPRKLRVITRFNLDDFVAGASDLEAIPLCMERGAEVRGVRNLHARVYVFGESSAVITSANLTNAALTRNQEFGLVCEEPGIIGECLDYFERLWKASGPSLSREQLDGWDSLGSRQLATGRHLNVKAGLGDFGADIGLPSTSASTISWTIEATQAFVKFFGRGRDSQDRSALVRKELPISGSHWACTYPRAKRPRAVRDARSCSWDASSMTLTTS